MERKASERSSLLHLRWVYVGVIESGKRIFWKFFVRGHPGQMRVSYGDLTIREWENLVIDIRYHAWHWSDRWTEATVVHALAKSEAISDCPLITQMCWRYLSRMGWNARAWLWNRSLWKDMLSVGFHYRSLRILCIVRGFWNIHLSIYSKADRQGRHINRMT